MFGETVIGNRFENMTPFREGFASVCVDGRWGAITHGGDYLIPPAHPDAVVFQDGYARMDWVFENEEMFCMDTKGRVIRPKPGEWCDSEKHKSLPGAAGPG